jgi:hypothetical protein
MLAGLLSALAVLTVRARFDDPDTWWHLKMGQVIWTTHAIPHSDIFSFTTNHHAYTAHEWLSQVLIFAAYYLGGYSGLMVFFCVTASTLLIAGYAVCSYYSGNAKVAFIGAMMIWFFSTVGLAIRPQMIGYNLLVVELLILHLARTRTPRWFLALIPLFAVWVNCHGSWFMGFTVAVAFFISSLFHFRAGSLVATAWNRDSQRTFLLSLGLSLAALLLNPNGIPQIMYPLETMFNQPISLSQSEEWQPLLMGTARGTGLLTVLVCTLLLVVIRRTDIYLHELFFLAIGVVSAASHRRMLFVFGILAAPILSRLLADTWDNYEPDQDRPLPNLIVLAASLFTICFAFPNSQDLAKQVERTSPLKAVEYIQTHHLAGPVLNDYLFGGYLIWAAPEYPVFIDGRADVFEWTGVLRQFGDWATLKSDPNQLPDKYGVKVCLLSAGSPLARVLPLLNRWKVAYADENAVVLVRASEATSGN